MNVDPRIVYAGAQTIYGVLFITMLFLRRSTDRTHRSDKLDALYLIFTLTIVLDTIWVFIDGKPSLRIFHIVLEVFDIIGIALYAVDYQGRKRDLYTPWRKVASRMWWKLLPFRRYLLAAYRRTLMKRALHKAGVKTDGWKVVENDPMQRTTINKSE